MIGDPHYRTYDGQSIHFYGECKYTLTKFIDSIGKCSFNIEVQNGVRCVKEPFTYTKVVTVNMFGKSFELDQHNQLKVRFKTFLKQTRNKNNANITFRSIM